MISICIPVFNTNISQLVSRLYEQSKKGKFAVEIIILDDGSSEGIIETNRVLEKIDSVQYHRQHNQGRIQSRATLARLAKYEWLLFLDDDSKIVSEHFLETYFGYLSDTNCVVTGGRIYTDDPPAACEFHLHWKYGKKRENNWHTAGEKNFRGFQTNNFLIHKSVFNALTFPGEMMQYGHEDTLMGIMLEQQGKTIAHIDNPVLHNRLEPADIFLKKAEHAVENIYLLSKKIDKHLLSDHIKLYRAYRKLQKAGLLFVVPKIVAALNNKISANLRSCSPSLFYFDLLRLNFLIEISG